MMKSDNVDPPSYSAVSTSPNSGSPPPNYASAAQGNINFGKRPTEWGSFSTTGLDTLIDLEKVDITKLFNIEGVVTYVDTPRQFNVVDQNNKQVFSMNEDMKKMTSTANHRSFEVDVFDSTGETVFTIIRDNSVVCSYCCFCCACFGNGCKTNVKVKVNERIIGSINQDCSFSHPLFTMYSGSDYDGEVLMHIEGASAACTPSVNYGFRIPTDTAPSGNIKKNGPNIGGMSNNYTLDFPTGANAEIKALCIAAVVLCDYRFFNPPMQRL